ncbi:hypothetical protein SEEA1957_21054 [Salmonella enterica subsp. enterica serovar Agona str. ATCC 51957]|nr:hypothetical protein SEEA1957_21054 [Salmonella enterica subsp. enterica serovar Agona str. ATCC 51957]
MLLVKSPPSVQHQRGVVGNVASTQPRLHRWRPACRC